MPQFEIGLPGQPSPGVESGDVIARIRERVQAVDRLGAAVVSDLGRLVNLVASYTTGDLVASRAEVDAINARRAQAGRPPISGGTPPVPPPIAAANPQVIAAALVATTPQIPPPPRQVAAAVIPPMWLADP